MTQHSPTPTTQDVLQRLSETLASRRNADPESSYTAYLLTKGPDSILKKIGEESIELIIAGIQGDRPHIIWEAADVLYHIMVLFTFYDLNINDVLAEMRRRESVSGIEEKKARTS